MDCKTHWIRRLLNKANCSTMLIQTVDDLRADLPITQKCAYLQTGSYSPVPASTQRYMAEMLIEENEVALTAGSKAEYSDFYQRADVARQTLAGLLGVSADEVAYSTNTTTATRLAVRSLDWRAGDKLALSDVEHASTFDMARGMQKQVGVTTTIFPSGEGPTFSPDYFLDQLARGLTRDHRLLILCQVANTDGRRLPVQEAVQIARSRGVKTLIDGAQAVGVFPVDVAAIDADFYTGSLHKWLMGPAGVGFLVVNHRQWAEYNPNWQPPDAKDGLVNAATRSELGTPNYVLRLGAAHSIENLKRIGLTGIETHLRELTAYLRRGVRVIPGVANCGPDGWELSSSITTLQFDGADADACKRLVAQLRERFSIVTKFRPEVGGVRVAVAAFNTIDEIDRLLQALKVLVPTICSRRLFARLDQPSSGL